MEAPRYYTAHGLSEAARVNRGTVIRLIAAGLVKPDAYFAYGYENENPLFLRTRVDDVVKHCQAARGGAYKR